MVFYLGIGGLTTICYPQNGCELYKMDSSNGKAFTCLPTDTEVYFCNIDCGNSTSSKLVYQGTCACVDAIGDGFNCAIGNPFYSNQPTATATATENAANADEAADGLFTIDGLLANEFALIVAGSVLAVCGLFWTAICCFCCCQEKDVVYVVDNEEVDGDETEFVGVENEVYVTA